MGSGVRRRTDFSRQDPRAGDGTKPLIFPRSVRRFAVCSRREFADFFKPT